MSLIDKIPENGSIAFSFYNVVDQANKGVRDSIGITVDPINLRTNIDELLDNGYQATSVKDITSGTAPNKSFALIACDGYDLDRGDENNILSYTKLKNIPLAFSIPAALVGQNTPSWTNQIEIALEDSLKAANGQTISFTIPNENNDQAQFATVNEAIILRNKLKDIKPSDLDGNTYVENICKNLSTALSTQITPARISDSPFDRKMTWDQIKSLSDNGHEIISHGFAHNQNYTDMSDQDIIKDVALAKQQFGIQANANPYIMTYPEGEFDTNIKSVLNKHGIKAAFTMTEGTIDENTNRMELPRVTVTQDMLLENG